MDELLDMPLEQLMDISVTSVAGVAQDWFDAPAALYVMTGDDLRRTGHRTLADALRVVPGVYVGSTGSHSWTVGMRGFSGGFANKTLVLIDGRAVYDPLFGGTFWDVQDILLEDLDRIEVIRGPGATLWGANAVNGVINVITKESSKTQGAYIKTGGGTEELGFGSMRYGGKISDKAHYRVWGKYFARDHASTSAGGSAHDEWDLGHGGFRFDYEPDEYTRVTLHGNGYDTGFDETSSAPVPGQHLQFVTDRGHGWASGANTLLRASRETPDGSGWSLQAYYDFTDRQQSGEFEVERHTADLDARHHFHIGKRNEVLWGLGYRHTTDKTQPAAAIDYDPSGRSLTIYSGFLQDTLTIVSGRVFAMLGTKLEHNSFTKFEIQPSGRLWWTPDDRNMLWASISRPVRVPTRTERDSRFLFGIADTGELVGDPPSGILVPLTLVGDPDLDSEKVLAYEIGHRIRITPELTLDTAAFYNDYENLIFVPPSTLGAFTDEGSGETYGVETSAYWRAMDRWSLEGSYTYVDVQIHGPILASDQGNSPHHQVKLRSNLNVTDDVELNSALYYVDRIPSANADPYVRFDQGVTWRVTKNVELTLWGQNLLDQRHKESSRTVEMDRAVYVAATFQF